jgi:hypothetical protein
VEGTTETNGNGNDKGTDGDIDVILDENDSEYRQQVGFEARNLRTKANEREMIPTRR